MKKFIQFFDTPCLIAILFAFTASMSFAKDYVIYSISQDVPMGTKDEVIRRNFYIDMGKNQGVAKDSVLDVYRIVSVLDPYSGKKRYNHKVKVGELKVLHAEDISSIGVLKKMEDAEDTPVVEINGLMIGDLVNVHVK